MKTNKKLLSVFAAVVLFCVAASGLTAAMAATAPVDYFVCLSTQNYAVRPSNKMTAVSGTEYELKNVSLSGLTQFYIHGSDGSRFLAANGDNMTVTEPSAKRYNIKFDRDSLYTVEGDFQKTDCHVTYQFYNPNNCNLKINGTETPVTYNPYNLAYEVYYISSVSLAKDETVTYNDTQTVKAAADGNYRILCTPGETINGNLYLFNEDGQYGTGDSYTTHIYMEDAPSFYAVYRSVVSETGDKVINGQQAFKLTRNEDNVNAAEYDGATFFVGERDTVLKYAVYEETALGYTLIDDDNDAETTFSRLTVGDVGRYRLAFTDGTPPSTTVVKQTSDLHNYYVAGNFNNELFDSDGNYDPVPRYLLTKVEEEDGDYSKDYDQYRIELEVTEKTLKQDDVTFYITNGLKSYRNGTKLITLNTAGTYTLLFSPAHDYGRGRSYRYSLNNAASETEEITISTTADFVSFARACTSSADYSVNKTIYLAADLNFNNCAVPTVKSFSGTFYGGYHTFSNLNLSTPSLFETVTRTGRIERLSVKNLTIDTTENYAALIGKNFGTISWVDVEGVVKGRAYVGGVVAYNGRSQTDDGSASTDSAATAQKSVVESCISKVSVTGGIDVGGVVGFNSGDILSSKNNGTVRVLKQTANANVLNGGGIAGYNAGKLYDCINDGDVLAPDAVYIGGVSGTNVGENYFCTNSGIISARRYGGGIVGYYGVVPTNSSDLADFFHAMGYDEFAALFTPEGEPSGDTAVNAVQLITYARNTGAVTSFSYAGGILGYTTESALSVRNCYVDAVVTVTAGSYAGGVAGFLTGATVFGSLTTGTVSADGMNGGNYVGGIAGYGDNVTACTSSAALYGKDYVGGLSGYHVGKLERCYTNVQVFTDTDAAHVGSIVGESGAYNATVPDFGGLVRYNYYLGTLGGIGGTEYGSTFSAAAQSITQERLMSVGTVSPYLDAFFAGNDWQGGDTEPSTPVPVFFETVQDTPELDDDAMLASTFSVYAPIWKAAATDATTESYAVSFLVWDEDAGNLYIDGELQKDNFRLLSTTKAHKGDRVVAPSIPGTETVNGCTVYNAAKARYFVSLNDVEEVRGSTVVYAVYREAVSTVATADNRILAEGLFDKQTVLTAENEGRYIRLRFTLDGKPFDPGTVTVRAYAGANAENAKIKAANSNTPTEILFRVVGEYVVFSVQSGQLFELIVATAAPTNAFMIVTVVLSVVAVGLGTTLIILLVKKKKPKKDKDDKTDDRSEDATSAANAETDTATDDEIERNASDEHATETTKMSQKRKPEKPTNESK